MQPVTKGVGQATTSALLLVAAFGCGVPARREPAPNARATGMDREIVWLRDGSAMALVPAGDVRLPGLSAKAPERTVRVAAFYIDKDEVTNRRYAQFLNSGGRGPDGGGLLATEDMRWEGSSWQVAPGREALPVEVSFEGARAYCQWAGKALPSWPQWLRAARGDDGRRYPWGDQWDPSRCVCRANSGFTCAPVGSRPSGASPFGAHDMAGNAHEWVVLPTFLRHRDPVWGHVEKALAGGGNHGDSGGGVEEIFGSLDSAIHTAHCSVCRYAAGFRCMVPAEEVVLLPGPEAE